MESQAIRRDETDHRSFLPAGRNEESLNMSPLLAALGGLATEGGARSARILGQRYILDKRIASGGTAGIWRALDRELIEKRAPNPYVAVKILHCESRGGDFPEEAEDALSREWLALQGLKHPNIVRHWDIGREDQCVFLVMEYLVGWTLAEILRDRDGRAIQLDTALDWLGQIGEALAWAHEHGVVHADIKPSNVKILSGGQVKLLDFGLAYRPERNGRKPSDALTPTYASPESFAGRAPAPEDDIFSFACVAYEMLSGRHPYDRIPSPQALRLALTPAPIHSLGWVRSRALAQGLALNRYERESSIRRFTDKLTRTGRFSWFGAYR